MPVLGTESAGASLEFEEIITDCAFNAQDEYRNPDIVCFDMSIIYMQIRLLQKDFLRDHGVRFPASSEGDCPSACHVSLLERP